MNNHHQDERPGHHWKEAERVQDFVRRMDEGRADERRDQLELLACLIPYEPDAHIRVLDLGAGYGAVSAAVLSKLPKAEAVLLDISEEMVRIGKERMTPFEGRYEYVTGDFADGVIPAEAGSGYHAIVSSLAIHHLPSEGKRTLYRDIFEKLLPGGCFLNLDSVSAPTRELQEVYRSAQSRQARNQQGGGGGYGHQSEMQPLALHLDWLLKAGFTSVDCFWKRLGAALFGGFKKA